LLFYAEDPPFFLHTGPYDLGWEIPWRKACTELALCVEIPEPMDDGSDLCLIANGEAWIKCVRDDAWPYFSVDNTGTSSRDGIREESRLERPDTADRLKKWIVS